MCVHAQSEKSGWFTRQKEPTSEGKWQCEMPQEIHVGWALDILHSTYMYLTCVAENSGLLYATSGLLIVGCVSIYMYIHTVPVEAGDNAFCARPVGFAFDTRVLRYGAPSVSKLIFPCIYKYRGRYNKHRGDYIYTEGI